MSAEVWVARPDVQDSVCFGANRLAPAREWNPQDFAREQIRGLVRQVFLSNVERPLRQVVFSAVDQETDARDICRRVGEALALETVGNVAVSGHYPQALSDGDAHWIGGSDLRARDRGISLRQVSIRVGGNLWLLPAAGCHADRSTAASLQSYLLELRREFEYSIVEGPLVGESSDTTAIAQVADGIILVLSAHRTRRIRALKIKDSLEAARVRILGTMLIDRQFPIPQGIYRRL